MKISKRIFLVTGSCILVLASCHYSKEYQTIDAGGKFTMSLPPWLKKDEKLKPGAELQYANRYRNVYVIGEAIDKSKTGKDFAAMLNTDINIIRSVLKEPVVSDSTYVNIDGLQGVRLEIFGKMSGENIYYSEVLLEDKTNFYHLSVWTRGEDRKLKYKEDINNIVNSFRAKGS